LGGLTSSNENEESEKLGEARELESEKGKQKTYKQCGKVLY
jgi:hypothetical protein